MNGGEAMANRNLRWLAAALLASAVASGAAHAQAPATEGRLTFPSANYENLGALIRGEGEPVQAAATFALPAGAAVRVPAIVIAHTIGGYKDANEGWFADEMRTAGYASFVLDFFGPRDIGGDTSSKPQPLASFVADAFNALKFLASDPRIDPQRIAIAGFSMGGDVTSLAAIEPARRAVVGGPLRFAAHVAFYPGLGRMPAPDAFTGAPMLMLLAEYDDAGPPRKLLDYLAYAKSKGLALPVRAVVYPGAYHAWTSSDIFEPRRIPQATSLRECPLTLLRAGPPQELADGNLRPLDVAGLRRCRGESRGYRIGYDAGVTAKSLAETLAFLRQVFAAAGK